MRKLVFLLCIFLSIESSAQEIKGITIDASIEEKAKDRFSSISEMEGMDTILCIYNNLITLDLFSDVEEIHYTEADSTRIFFKTFHFKNGDTIAINGGIGMFEGTGFYIRIIKDSAELFHFASSDFPTFAFGQDDTLLHRIEVPCRSGKIILSQVPSFKRNEIIYGYVEFESEKYFVESSNIDSEKQRESLRVNMKVYFKSREFPFDMQTGEAKGE